MLTGPVPLRAGALDLVELLNVALRAFSRWVLQAPA
jgi:hypothetical protein